MRNVVIEISPFCNIKIWLLKWNDKMCLNHVMLKFNYYRKCVNNLIMQFLKSTLTFSFEMEIDSSPINGLNYNVCLTCTEWSTITRYRVHGSPVKDFSSLWLSSPQFQQGYSHYYLLNFFFRHKSCVCTYLGDVMRK